MKVLIACEESQAVCMAFRKYGHQAFSCDIQPCSGGHPEYHIQGDALQALFLDDWDLVIVHPPCTFLTSTGNRWFNVDRYGDKAIKRLKDRQDAADFFMCFVYYALIYHKRVAIENPIGFMSTYYRKPDQIVQPYMFGDPFEKRTGLWLFNLDPLIPTNIVSPPERVVFSSGKSMPVWYAELWSLPKDERSRLRSVTFPGIADAMASQWGCLDV